MRSRLALVLAALIGSFAAPLARADAGWVWPVDGRVIGRFHLRWSPYAAGSNRGIDIGAPLGTPVVSACSGRVAFAGWIGTSGRTVSVVCGGLTATYVNLGSVTVRRGAVLPAGEELGSVGDSGRPRPAAPHLHFGVHRSGRRNAYLDPLTLLPRRGRPPVPVVPALPRRGPAPLGPSPTPAPPATVIRVPVGGQEGSVPSWPARAPLVAWIGLGLLAVGVPGTGFAVRWRRTRGRRRAQEVRSAAG